MQEQILEMLEMQSNLNDFTNGEKWRSGVTNKGKTINWHTAILLEGAELIDSTPWKHWKNIDGSSDIDNIKIEVVDIFHFYLSEALRTDSPETLSFIIESQFLEFLNDKASFDFTEVNRKTKQLMLISLLADVGHKEYDVTEAARFFGELLSVIGMSFQELYVLYISKNVLNIFRQNNGYKEGTYVKNWDGVEDNIILTDLKNTMEIVTFDKLYSGLEKRYKNIK